MQPGATEYVSITNLAAAHDLAIVPETITLVDVGLDFQVALAETTKGEPWVLRIPRRPDVTSRAAVEGRFLRCIAPRLEVAVPDWRIHTDQLIAYPLLPGEPGLTVDPQGQPTWHFDTSSLRYARSLGEVLAELHRINPEEVRSTGIEILSAAEVRQRKREDIATVQSEFMVAPELQERWAAWLADDRYWPQWTTLTHGEIYPAHQLLEGERIVGILDWTTASVSDPAKDFVFHQASVPAEAFEATVRRYVECGGRVWPELAEHCAELFSTAPVDYGLFALQTGDPTHSKAAAALLNPPQV